MAYWAKLVHTLGGVPFFGTVLGVIRDGRVIESDDDVDFTVPQAKKGLLVKALLADRSISFTLVSDWILQVSQIIDGEAILIDFYLFTDEGPDIRLPWNFSGTPWQNHSHLLVPKDLVSQIRWKSNMDYCAEGHGLAEYLYGAKWQLTLRKFVDYEIFLRHNRPVAYYPGRIRRIARGRFVALDGAQNVLTAAKRRALLLVSLRWHEVLISLRDGRVNRCREEALLNESRELIAKMNEARDNDCLNVRLQ